MESARAIVSKVGESLGIRTQCEGRAGAAPEAVILDLAGDGLDLIVLGTDLRPASDRLFLKPKVERLLTNAGCPVVVTNAS